MMRPAEIEQLLPSVLRRTALPGSPLAAVLEAMEALHAPDEAILDELDSFLDPRRAPDQFVVYLAGWVGLGWLVSHAERRAALTENGALRDLVANGARLARMRGTREGLREFLSLATGGWEFDVVGAHDEDGRERAFTITVIAPAELEARRPLLQAIVQHEKPVYVQYELRFSTQGPGVPGAAPSTTHGNTAEPVGPELPGPPAPPTPPTPPTPPEHERGSR